MTGRRTRPTTRPSPPSDLTPRLRRPSRSSAACRCEIPTGRITVIVGPNACGKSTLLRALARLLKPKRRRRPARRRVDPQAADPRGGHPARHPAAVAGGAGGHHRRRPRRPRPVPAPGLVPPVDGGRPTTPSTPRSRATGTLDLAGRPVDELSGGQRQRVWIAMTLAQGTGPDAPRRADDVPRHGPPGRDPRSARRPQPARGAHHRARAARPQPGVPLRPPPRRDARRGDRRRGRTGPDRHRRTWSPTSSGCRCRVIDDPVSGTPLVVPIGRHLHVSAEAAESA